MSLIHVFISSDKPKDISWILGKDNLNRCDKSMLEPKSDKTQNNNRINRMLSVPWSLHISPSDFDLQKTFLFLLCRISLHPKFKESTMDYDIAVVLIRKIIDWFEYPHIRPICLPVRNIKTGKSR